MVLWCTIQGAMVTMPFPGADAWHRPLRVVCGSLGALNLATGNGDDVLPQCGCLAPSTIVAGCLWQPWCRTTAMLALQIMSTKFATQCSIQLVAHFFFSCS
jgi:hypothetical protein